MAAKFVSIPGKYGQVEPNRLTAMVNGEMESQAPAYTDASAGTAIPELENGMFLCVIADENNKSPMGRIAVLPAAAPANAVPMLVYSEKKIYDERKGYADFVDVAAEKVDGVLYPRLFRCTPDVDVFTTNTVNADKGTLEVGDILYVGDDGYLTETAATNTTIQFAVTKVYTMPDGQPGVKLLCQRKPGA